MADPAALCDGLARAVQAMLDPLSPQSVRMEAFTHCETFKERSPPAVSIQCGLMLCDGKNVNVVRHFGLKLIEDTIKLHWNDMPGEQKLFVKDSAMRLMESGVSDLLTEATHIKDAISRIVVEIIKREWPQHWPNLLAELEAICGKGDTQTELVMFVLLRTVEDVAVLQTLEQNQRRKEIYQALVAQMDTIFCFLLTFLERHYQAYLANGSNEIQQRHSKICEAVLSTFNAFVEWVPMTHIMANDHYLLRCLCHLLSDERLQLHAAECLLSIVGWKVGKLPDRAQLLILFKTEMMAPIFQAVETAERKSHDEKHYVFLKRMVQILVELGGQVCYVWSNGTGSDYKMPPENFDVYLNALLAFTRHDSQMVNFYANELWAKFLRQADIAKDDLFRSFIPKWVETAMKKAVKVGHPSRDTHPSCNYSALDFESDEEFLMFFGRYRIILFEVIKLISAVSPVIPYNFTDVWLRSLLSSQPDFGKGKVSCSVDSPVYLELDAIQLILDAVMSKLTGQDELKPILGPAVELLKLCLDYQTTDPVLSSVLLSCISSLFVIVNVTPAALMPTLKHVFDSITFGTNSGVANGGISTAGLSNEVRLLRRHGCCLLVKVGSRYPKTLLPVFDHLRTNIVNEFNLGRLLKMEFVTLVEALVLISNEFANYSLQSGFLKSLSEPVCHQFRALLPVISSPSQFMRHIGLVPGSDLETCQKNRADLGFCLNFLLSIAKRSSCPISDIAKLREGGFINSQAGLNSQQNVLALLNPAGQVGIAVLDIFISLAKTLNELWSPACLAQIAPEMAKALDLLDAEKKALIGISLAQRSSSVGPNDEDTQQGSEDRPEPSVQPSERSELQRVQIFIYEQYENVYHFLAQCCNSFGYEFYCFPNLGDAIITGVLQGLPNIPDFRLRVILRTFLKSLINKCPHRYFASVVAPLLHQLLPYMLSRLTEKWNRVIALRESPQFDEENADSQEVLEDVVCRQLTREYLDVVKAVLTSGGGSDLKFDDSKVYASTENLSKSGSEGAGSHNLSLSDLGKLVLQHNLLCQHVVNTLLEVLLWPDSMTSVRASHLLELIIPVVASHENLDSQQAVRIIYTILRALHTLGQHEAIYIALIQLSVLSYELLRAKHPCIVEVLTQIPGCTAEEVKRFDDHVIQVITGKENGLKSGSGKMVGDRTLKNMFKKLSGQLIGKNVAQLFKQEVVIKNLPTLYLGKPRHKTPSLEDSEKHELGITSLFGQNGTTTSAESTLSTSITPAFNL